MGKLTKSFLLLFILLAVSGVWGVQGQGQFPSADWEFDCSIWGHYEQGAMCKIDAEKVPAFLYTQLTTKEREILASPYPVLYYCIVRTVSKNDIQRSANFHIRPHENSPVLVKYGLPYNTYLQRIQFIYKPEGSKYSWVKVRWQGMVGYVARHNVGCNRPTERPQLP